MSVLLLWPSSVATAVEEPTAGDLVRVLKAQEERIRAFSCTWHETKYSLNSPGLEEKLLDADVVMRWTREGAVTEVTKTQYNKILGGLVARDYTDVRSVSDSKDCSKMLRFNPGIDNFRGRVLPPSPVAALDPLQRPADLAAESPFHAMYSFIRPDYMNLLLADSAKVERTEDGYLHLTSAANSHGQVLVYTLDPTKNYVPVACVWSIPEGSGKEVGMSMRTQFRDFSEVANGLWLPQEYETLVTGVTNVQDAKLVKTVKMFQLNPEFKAGDLDLRFPNGTVVEDRIAGLTYTVAEKVGDAAALSSVLDTYQMAQSDAAITVPSKGEELPSESAMRKALESIPAPSMVDRIKTLHLTRRGYLLFLLSLVGSWGVVRFARRSRRRK